MPFKTAVKRLFFSSTVLPKRELVVSKSANSPLISDSEGYPFAEFSKALKIVFRSVFKLLFLLALVCTFINSCEG